MTPLLQIDYLDLERTNVCSANEHLIKRERALMGLKALLLCFVSIKDTIVLCWLISV
jgi:hypothetical protein